MISYIVPTVGRPSLVTTLASIECRPGDEVLIVGNLIRALEVLSPTARRSPFYRFVHCPSGGDWGHTERNFASPLAQGTHIAHIDDDDVYAPGTRDLMADAISTYPDRPTLFRMRYPNGITLWDQPELRCGNVGTPMMLIPNQPEKLGFWGPFVGGDCHFLETMGWPPEAIVWRPEVIALLGHNT